MKFNVTELATSTFGSTIGGTSTNHHKTQVGILNESELSKFIKNRKSVFAKNPYQECISSKVGTVIRMETGNWSWAEIEVVS